MIAMATSATARGQNRVIRGTIRLFGGRYAERA
jgi:hypothetical protein